MTWSITRMSFVEGALSTLMVGFGETVALTYLSSLHMSGATLGILATVPPAIGAVCQAVMPFMFKRKSVVSITLAAVALQIVGLVLLGISFLAPTLNVWNVGIAFTAYWIGGMCGGAPWQEWISQLVDGSIQNRFFARRAAFLSLILLMCYFIVGFVLNNRLDKTWVSISIFAAVLCRILGFITLYRHPRPVQNGLTTEKKLPSGLSPWRERVTGQTLALSLWRLSLFAMAFRVAVCLSGPFFAPYMLQELQHDTLTYFSLTGIPLMVRVVFMANWGRLLDEKRIFEGLLICILGISILPILWVWGDSNSSLTVWQVLSGLVWSGYELMMLIFIQRLYPHAIMRSLAVFLAASSLGNAIGGYLGGYIHDQGYSYHDLFTLSTILRLATGVVFLAYLRRCHAFRLRDLQLRAGMATVLSLDESRQAFSKARLKVTNTVKDTLWKSS